MPDYSAMRAEGRSIGQRHGKAMAQIEENRRKQERKQQMEQRFRELADNKAAQQNELARSQYAQTQAEQANENQLVAAAVSNGTMDPDGTYKKKHWDELAIESLGGNVKDLTQEQIDAESARIAGGAQKGYTRKYSSNVAAQNLQKQLEYNEAVREREGSREYFGDGVDGAIGRLGQKAADSMFGKEEELVAPTMQEQPQGKQFGFNEEYTGSVPDATEVKRQNLQQVNVEGAEGNFWLDPVNGQIRGPGTNGWVSAENLSTIPQDRSPLTVAYTDMKTGEEMKGTLIETFPGDEQAVMNRGGKYFAPVSTPVKLRGTQDQHGPKGLTKQQNKDLGYRDSAFNVQSLSTEMLNQDYQGNPAGWVAARMSSIGDMFGSVIPDLNGTENDLPAIIDYIKSNVSEDAKASQELGILDARAVAEGNVVAINKLLSYGTALWMNGGTRITTKVSEDAAEISEAWISGTAQHKGKLASLRNQASKSYARNASRHLNFARQDDTNEMWSQYPTARRKREAGWDFAVDKAEGYALKQQLAALKKKDPEAYRLSVESLEGTMSSMDTIETPIFWSSKFQTNVMLYHKTDPKTGAIRFATFKTE
jgi:hypothetical protein